MKWKTKIPLAPSVNTVRVISRFAWLPTDLDDGHSVWLQSYQVKQIWTKAGLAQTFKTGGEILVVGGNYSWLDVKSFVG